MKVPTIVAGFLVALIAFFFAYALLPSADEASLVVDSPPTITSPVPAIPKTMTIPSAEDKKAAMWADLAGVDWQVELEEAELDGTPFLVSNCWAGPTNNKVKVSEPEQPVPLQ